MPANAIVAQAYRKRHAQFVWLHWRCSTLLAGKDRARVFMSLAGANMGTQRSYASDYVGLAILIAGYILVSTCKPREELNLTRKVQIQFLAEPFHRMFFLDNLAIGYPHAEVERVSVCAFTAADFLTCNANLDV
jgi:hypothetical protein